ncbi:MAG: hypothetical protein GXO35_08015 [Gammaproteobacteria bacterium]|nr:hypothetical protein [Gammaproteobacteria bacterium]
MSELTYIKGKDDCLEVSIEKMQAALLQAGFDIVEASWLNPVTNVYSLHIYEKKCPGLFTNGKGVCRKSTLASALGEFIERLSTNYFFSDYWLERVEDEAAHDWLYYPNEKSFSKANLAECLSPELWSFYDTDEALSLVDLLSFNDSQNTVRAIELHQVGGGAVYFPMNLLSNLYASNGLSAGNTAVEAQVQGLSEIFERWVKNKIMRENICLPEVPQTVVNHFPEIVAIIEGMKQEGIAVSIRDASLGGVYPVINVTLFEQKTGLCFASFGAHPIFEVALERTLTESLQGRNLGNLDGFQMPVFDAFTVAEDENLENHFIDSSGLIHVHFISDDYDYDFVHWNFSGDTEAQWDTLCALVEAAGYTTYVANYRHYGFEACRVVVPGMSEIYPVEEVIERNQNMGRMLRESLLRLEDSVGFDEVINLIDELGFSDHQGVASLIGLMPDPHSFWAELKIVDLKFWCYLALGEKEAALESLQGSIYFLSESSHWLLVYKTLMFALEMALTGVTNRYSVTLLFGAKLTNQAWLNVQAGEGFWGECLGRNLFKQSQQHCALLDIYMQSRQVKLEGA